MLGRSDVALHDSSGKLVKTAPTAADLFAAASGDYLDLPGDPLHPGCSYEKWARQIGAGKPTTSYAHIVTEPGKPGKLALQYWFYYPFNDFNNKHESDWEMIQLMFDASTAAEALEDLPTEVGYSQHSGAERAAWDDPKLEKRGSHPIVYPGQGSHANYFSQSVWLGHGPEEGFGCDDTRAPSDLVQTEAVLMPTDAPTSATSPFAWLAYTGHGGRRRRARTTGRPARTRRRSGRARDLVEGQVAVEQLRGPAAEDARHERDDVLLLRGRARARRCTSSTSGSRGS